jgi:hypothetical protein
MKNRIFIVVVGACLIAASLPAATYTVKVNADGSFSPPTMSQWAAQFQSRRRTLFPSLPDPFPKTYRHTFTRTLTQPSGNQIFYYVHGAKCGVGNAVPGAIVIQGTAPELPPRHRSVKH